MLQPERWESVAHLVSCPFPCFSPRTHKHTYTRARATLIHTYNRGDASCTQQHHHHTRSPGKRINVSTGAHAPTHSAENNVCWWSVAWLGISSWESSARLCVYASRCIQSVALYWYQGHGERFRGGGVGTLEGVPRRRSLHRKSRHASNICVGVPCSESLSLFLSLSLSLLLSLSLSSSTRW